MIGIQTDMISLPTSYANLARTLARELPKPVKFCCRGFPISAPLKVNNVLVAHYHDHENISNLIEICDIHDHERSRMVDNQFCWFPYDIPFNTELLDKFLDTCVADGTVPVSMSRTFEGREHGYSNENLHCISPCYDPRLQPVPGAREEFREDLGLKDGEKLLLFVGRALDRKNIDTLVATMKYLEGKARLIIHTDLSDPEQEININSLLYSMGADNVYIDSHPWWKGVPVKQMAALYTAADFFITASCGEGFCLPVIEAGACGTLTIAPDVHPFTEFKDWNFIDAGGILLRKSTYRLAPDPRKFAEYVSYIISDSWEKERRAWQKHVMEAYSPEKTASDWKKMWTCKEVTVKKGEK